MADCIFCKIINGEMDTKFLYEDDSVVVFNDIRPKANTHILIVSKKHIPSLMHLDNDDDKLMGHMVQILPKIAANLGISSFRTIVNTGAESGQEVDHLHFHLLSGNLRAFG